MRPGPPARAALIVALAGLAACDSATTTTDTLHVFAASSLTDVLTALEAGFEGIHPTVDVVVTLAGSQTLRLQIEQGAPADVFLSANRNHVSALADAGLLFADTMLADNDLVIVVPAESPTVRTFDDLASPHRLVVGDPSVPIGRYTDDLLQRVAARDGEGRARAIRSRVVSRESNVRLVRAKVALGEADAAVVYRTDAVSAEGLAVVEIPSDLAVPVDYHVAITARAARSASARSFYEYVRSEAGSRILEAHGFRVDRDR